MHYYSFHIGDYKSHTHHLSLIEDLAYRRLLDLYYLSEKPIAPDQAARLIGMREHGHEVLCVLMEFFVETDSGFISPRADKEIESYKAMSSGGKRGANKRWNKVPVATLSPTDSPPIEPLIATNNHKPLTNNQEPLESKPLRAKARFDAQAHLVSLGVCSDVVDDWLAIRKAKKLPATKTAIEAIEQEVAKAGWPIEKALRECCNRGWGGFKASWLIEQSEQQPRLTQHQLNQQAIARSIGLIPKQPTPFDYLEGEVL